jgi:2-polyprenyl-3-methyl-5-hydroxy-6-metoxy-1,4-benzoquinol methylase
MADILEPEISAPVPINHHEIHRQLKLKPYSGGKLAQYNYDAKYYEEGIGGFHAESFLPITRALEKYVPLDEQKSEVLDFGCGNGFYGKFLRSKAARVEAIDKSDVILTSSNKQYYDDVRTADLGAPLHIERQFDVLYSVEVIEHVKDYSIYLENAFNTLKPGGYLFLTTTTYFWSVFVMLVIYRRETSFAALREFIAGLFGSEKARTKFVIRFWDYFTGHYHGFTASQIRRGLEAAGFELVKIENMHVQPVFPVNYLNQEYNGGFKPIAYIVIAGLKVIGRGINTFCRVADVAAPNVIVVARKKATR